MEALRNSCARSLGQEQCHSFFSVFTHAVVYGSSNRFGGTRTGQNNRRRGVVGTQSQQ